MRAAVGAAVQAGARLERPVELDAQAGRHGRRPWLQQAEMLHAAALQRLVEAAAGRCSVGAIQNGCGTSAIMRLR